MVPAILRSDIPKQNAGRIDGGGDYLQGWAWHILITSSNSGYRSVVVYLVTYEDHLTCYELRISWCGMGSRSAHNHTTNPSGSSSEQRSSNQNNSHFSLCHWSFLLERKGTTLIISGFIHFIKASTAPYLNLMYLIIEGWRSLVSKDSGSRRCWVRILYYIYVQLLHINNEE